MVVPVGSNLYSETWNIVHSLISGNVTDPALSGRSTGKLKMIFGAFPDVEKSRPDFPIIIIDNPQADSSKQTFGTGAFWDKNISVSVWAYSQSNQQVNSLADDITDAFIANKLGLLGSNLTLRNIDAGAAGTDSIGGDRVHYREVQAKFGLMISGA